MELEPQHLSGTWLDFFREQTVSKNELAHASAPGHERFGQRRARNDAKRRRVLNNTGFAASLRRFPDNYRRERTGPAKSVPQRCHRGAWPAVSR